MPCLRSDYNGFYVTTENKVLMIRPVENKIKLMFRMQHSNPFQVFECKPSDPFQLPPKQQSRIYRNSQLTMFYFPTNYIPSGMK